MEARGRFRRPSHILDLQFRCRRPMVLAAKYSDSCIDRCSVCLYLVQPRASMVDSLLSRDGTFGDKWPYGCKASSVHGSMVVSGDGCSCIQQKLALPETII